MPAAKRPAAPLRSSCPIAGTLDLIGDRWTLLILRDLFGRPRRYGDLAGAAESIPTNILAARLARMEECGLIASEPYQQNPPRYTYALTAKGRDLQPVMVALALWGQRHVRGTRIPAAMATALR